MRSQVLFLFVTAVCLSQLVNSESLSNALTSRQSTSPGDLPECTFKGNSDFYGVGVRVGFYLTWISGLIAFVLNPEDLKGQADAQTVFLLANLIALIILQVQSAAETNVVVPILLFYIFFGGSVIGITSAIASLGSFKNARRVDKVSTIVRQVLVQLTSLGTLIYSFYFWTRGFQYFKTFDKICGGTFVFPVRKRLALDKVSGGSVLALLFLVIFYILIGIVSYKRLRRSFGNIPVSQKSSLLSKFIVSKESFGISKGNGMQQTPPWDKTQRKWTLIGGMLITFTIIWAIAGIELTISWNRVTDVDDLSSTGQLIPFVMGLASLPSAFWGAFSYRQEVKADQRSQLSDNSETSYLEKPQMTPVSPYFNPNKPPDPARTGEATPADAAHPLLEQESATYVSPTASR